MNIKQEIISMIDAECMKNYLLEHMNDLRISEFVEIIVGAPKALKQKADFLTKLLECQMNEDDHKYVNQCLQVIQEAIGFLYHGDSNKVRMVLRCIDTEGKKQYTIDAVPVLSYEDALRYIKEEFGVEDDNECLDFYFCLDLYEITENDKLLWKYEYICNERGEVQFFRAKNLKKNGFDRFFWNIGMEHFPTPYQVGDVLYIDCRPFLQPHYCVIYYTFDRRDCCGIRCLFLTDENMVQEGALKHGHFYPTDSEIQCPFSISPLYRAEICKEIPEEVRLLEDIGHMLKQNPSMSEKLDKFFCENREIKFVEEQVIAKEECKVGDELTEGVTQNELLRYINRQCAKGLYEKYEKLMHRLADR